MEYKYDIQEEPIVLSKSLMDLLLEQENPADLIALYTFLYYTAKWQKTNQVKATVNYIAKGLGWSETRVRKNKKVLKSLRLIDDIIARDKENKITGHYVYIRFIWSNEKIHPIRNPQGGNSDTVENLYPNALSANSRNALSSNNESYITGSSYVITHKTTDGDTHNFLREKNKKNSSLEEKSFEKTSELENSADMSKKNNAQPNLNELSIGKKISIAEALIDKDEIIAKIQMRGVIPDWGYDEEIYCKFYTYDQIRKILRKKINQGFGGEVWEFLKSFC